MASASRSRGVATSDCEPQPRQLPVVESISALNGKSEPGPRQLGAAEFVGSEAEWVSRVNSAITQAAPDLILNYNYKIRFFDVTTEVLGTGDIEGSFAPIQVQSFIHKYFSEYDINLWILSSIKQNKSSIQKFALCTHPQLSP